MDVDSEIEGGAIGTSTELPLDTVFKLLASKRRRLALDCLRGTTRARSAADVAKEIAIREQSEDTIDQDEAIQIHTELVHNHIPRLVDAGIVEYDQDRRLVSLNEKNDLTVRLLDAIDNNNIA